MDQKLPSKLASQNDCDELASLLPAYGLGATTAEEKARVEELLPLCPKVAADLAQYLAISTGLAQSIEPVTPPAHLRNALLSRLAEETAEATPAKPIKVPVKFALPAWVAAAACLALLLTNLLWFFQYQTLQSQQHQLEIRNDELFSLIELDGDSIPVLATEGSQELAQLYWSSTSNQATLYSSSLESLSPELAYQLWLIEGDLPIDAGVFTVDSDGRVFYRFQFEGDLTDYQAIAISIEPFTGSPAPTTNPIALAPLG